MRRLRLPHGVIKRYRLSPRPGVARFSPNGKTGTDGAVQRGPGRKAEDRRRTVSTTNHDECRGCSHKRESKAQGSGWSDNNYWTGEVNNGGNNARIVNRNGNDNDNPVNNDNPVVCLR